MYTYIFGRRLTQLSENLQERLSACLEEERQRGREMTNQALQEARVEREAYVQQQRQVQLAVQNASLPMLTLNQKKACTHACMHRHRDTCTHIHMLSSFPPSPYPSSHHTHTRTHARVRAHTHTHTYSLKTLIFSLLLSHTVQTFFMDVCILFCIGVFFWGGGGGFIAHRPSARLEF